MASDWISVNGQLGYPKPGTVDSSAAVPLGTVASFRDIGTTALGLGEFIYLKGVASTVLGSVVSYQVSDGTAQTGTTTLWAGTVNMPVPLALATAATVASTYGWYQIGGSAICAISGTIADGDDLFYQAAGVLSATLVAGKQALGIQAASANAVPSSGKAIATLDRPHAQGATDNAAFLVSLLADPHTWAAAQTFTAAIVDTGGIGAAGGFSASPRPIATGGVPATAAGDGNDSTPVITETYISEVFVPCNMTITGVALFNGSDVTGNVTVGLATSAGAPIAAAKSASTAGLGTDAYQRVPFAVAYAAAGPATYYIQVQYSSGTARYNTHTVGNFGVLVQTGQTYGTLTSFTAPSTFVTNVANIASLY